MRLWCRCTLCGAARLPLLLQLLLLALLLPLLLPHQLLLGEFDLCKVGRPHSGSWVGLASRRLAPGGSSGGIGGSGGSEGRQTPRSGGRREASSIELLVLSTLHHAACSRDAGAEEGALGPPTVLAAFSRAHG